MSFVQSLPCDSSSRRQTKLGGELVPTGTIGILEEEEPSYINHELGGR